jgi:hypothetical protein
MKTQYTKGFESGFKYARQQVLEFLNAHHDLGDILTLEEVIIEIEHWDTKDNETLRGLADGRVAPIKGLEECKGLCEDCFGTDLCIVCEGVSK